MSPSRSVTARKTELFQPLLQSRHLTFWLAKQTRQLRCTMVCFFTQRAFQEMAKKWCRNVTSVRISQHIVGYLVSLLSNHQLVYTKARSCPSCTIWDRTSPILRELTFVSSLDSHILDEMSGKASMCRVVRHDFKVLNTYRQSMVNKYFRPYTSGDVKVLSKMRNSVQNVYSWKSVLECCEHLRQSSAVSSQRCC